jgi:beta-lactamase class D
MNKAFLLLGIKLMLCSCLIAEKQSFLVKENNRTLIKKGNCTARHAPCSTFKIAISLMGYNEGLLVDDNYPELAFKVGYPDYIDVWKQPHTPSLWISHSCVWFSQILTRKLGFDKFKEYVTKFNYGNKDVSGDKNKNNGLTKAWLSSSLEISTKEQVKFLQKLLKNELPVSEKSHAMARKILFVEDLYNGWELYGKTGSGSLLNHDKTKKLDLQIGWFIGWIEKDNKQIAFAQYLEDEEKKDTYASLRARALAKEKLIKLIQKNQNL